MRKEITNPETTSHTDGPLNQAGCEINDLAMELRQVQSEHAALVAVAEAASKLLVWLNDGGATKTVWPQSQEQYDIRSALATLSSVRKP